MRRRIPLALVAATSTMLALVVPAQAQSSSLSSGSSLSSTAEAETQEPEDETQEEPVAEGSSFMGPDELLQSILGGYGSSGVPETEQDPETEEDAEEEELNLEDYPEWMHGSIAPSDELQMAMAVIEAVLAVGATATQAAVIVLPLLPGGLDTLRSALANFGIQV